MLTNEIKNKIQEEVNKRCKEKGYEIIRMTILGSHFIGTANQYSDVDVFVSVILPKEYYLGDLSIPNFHYDPKVEIEGLDVKVDINYRDIRKLITEYNIGLNYTMDALLNGVVLQENDDLKTILKKYYNPDNHLKRIAYLFDSYLEDIKNDGANGKHACRIIRDIARTIQIFKTNDYDDKSDIFTYVDNNPTLMNIIHRQHSGELVMLNDNEKEIIKDLLNELRNKIINRLGDIYSVQDKDTYYPELTSYLVNLIEKHLYN